jgi:hypothetical protein
MAAADIFHIWRMGTGGLEIRRCKLPGTSIDRCLQGHKEGRIDSAYWTAALERHQGQPMYCV